MESSGRFEYIYHSCAVLHNKISSQGYAEALAASLSKCKCLRPRKGYGSAGATTSTTGDALAYADATAVEATCNGGPCRNEQDVKNAIKTQAFTAGAAQLYINLAAMANSYVEASACASGAYRAVAFFLSQPTCKQILFHTHTHTHTHTNFVLQSQDWVDNRRVH
jgi:hypothetical protein